eukprot:CAMPEP_0116018970 /NCGR_PEP_ID=MMETSP0321-20121206/8957_1 /TAXON_ID=163516 /ORGANISM="Leptocylindrus danicus var. danicus, Strain B650" /LENGTH=499 /DNA_ID=CAMNT_0003489449 /DNA_START=115 /DNA_END=1610 /DNA_ORIENTATION=+
MSLEKETKARSDLVEKLFLLHEDNGEENADISAVGSCDGNDDAEYDHGSSKSTTQHTKGQEKENMDNEIPQKERVQLKRMKKRQENALVQAERERMAARSFAAAERSAVAKWANDQRSQIDKLRKQVKKEQLLLQKTKHETAYRKKKEAELEALRATIEKMKVDGEACTKRFRTNEARLRDRIRTQTSQIQQLKQQLLTIDTNDCIMSLPMTDDKSVQVNSYCGEMRDTLLNTSGRPSLGACPDTDNDPDVSVDTISKATEDESDSSSPVQTNVYGQESFTSHQIQVESSLECTQEKFSHGEEELLGDDLLKENSQLFEHGQETMLWLAGGVSSTSQKGFARAADAVTGLPPNIHYGTSKTSATRCENTEIIPNDCNAGGSCKRAPLSKTEHNFPDGRTTVLYGNGTYKEIHPNGQTIIRYTNGDIKTSHNDRKVEVYYYANANTTHTTYPDGKQMFEFHAKNQKEYHYPDGRKEIISEDNSRRMVHANGVIERVLPDG